MNIAVVFAGGTGSRMHSKDRPKQFLEIQGKPILVHTVTHFQKNKHIDAIVVVCIAEWLDHCIDLCNHYNLTKVMAIIPGGETGMHSIYKGLKKAKEIAGDEASVVLIHDGVRPLINSNLITANIECVEKYGACITVAVIKETIIEIAGDDQVDTITDRSRTRAARAPQSFKLDEVLGYFDQAIASDHFNYIDTCSLMHHYGVKLHMIEGPLENIKITTPDDYYMMRSILQQKEDAQIYGMD